MVSCTPEEYELGEVDVTSDELVEGIAFEIVHDTDNPNIVYLKSLMDSKYTSLWSHPQGRSQKTDVELKMPFAGTYNVQFGVQTRGGVVYGDTVTFEVEEFYAGFIDDPLWELITGGIGKNKTWLLDLDAEGVSKFFAGPLYFYGTDDSWETVTEGKTVEGDVWNWSPDWKGNQWLMDAGDYGTMTFGLEGNATVVVDNPMFPETNGSGTFLLDTENKTITLSDVGILHNPGHDAVVNNWGFAKVMSLTEDAMQLGVLRDNSDEGEALLVYNFISKEYSDNWVPGEVEEPEPTLPEGWKEDISKTVNTSIIWKLSESNPIDWANLDGTMMNGWLAPEDYPDWLGTPDPSVYGDFSMTLNSDNSTVTFVTPDGTTTEGTYSLDEKGIYSFDIDVPSFAVIGWASFAADANNELRILQVDKDAAGSVTGMWIGARSSEKDEYLAYHLMPSGGSSESDPMDAWKSALAGKTFVPDVNYFADWYAADWSGGWTAEGIFPDQDLEGQSWFWNQEVYDACLASSITFYMEDGLMKADAVDNGTEKNGIVVDIDTEESTLTFSEAPFTFSWIFTDNNDGLGFWLMGSHDGANLGNVDTKGLYLGFYSAFDETDSEVPTEITAVHFVVN